MLIITTVYTLCVCMMADIRVTTHESPWHSPSSKADTFTVMWLGSIIIAQPINER